MILSNKYPDHVGLLGELLSFYRNGNDIELLDVSAEKGDDFTSYLFTVVLAINGEKVNLTLKNKEEELYDSYTVGMRKKAEEQILSLVLSDEKMIRIIDKHVE